MFFIGLILGIGLGVFLCKGVFIWAFNKYLDTITALGRDLEKEFDSLPIQPKQLNDNPIYTVMNGSERIH